VPSTTDNLGLHPELRPEQIGISNGATENDPTCFICSNHPLAFSSIKDSVCSDARLRPRVRSYYSRDPRLLLGVEKQILILDTCSVLNWAACLDKWTSEGGIVIALLSPEVYRPELELHMLCLGAAGVLTFRDLQRHLLEAIYTVSDARLWFKREVLHEYVRQTRGELRRVSSHSFTTREKQILDFLMQDLPNRMIAQRLTVSERTIKFHVSNILRKLNVTSRKELRGVSSNSTNMTSGLWPKFENKISVQLVKTATNAPL
jgi:DNA-binding CsgD family transcriptional regulator